MHQLLRMGFEPSCCTVERQVKQVDIRGLVRRKDGQENDP